MCCVPEEQPQDRSPTKERKKAIPRTVSSWGLANRLYSDARCLRVNYLLVLLTPFSGWVEAYPTRVEKSLEVVKALLKEIIPHFGLPGSIQSDKGPAFISEITQGVSKFLGVKWRPHMAWRLRLLGRRRRWITPWRKIQPSCVKKLISIGIKLCLCLLPCSG